VQLTSDATVSACATVAVGAAHNTPTVIAILERSRGADTPPRDVDVHLNSHGISMPVRRPPTPGAPAPPPARPDSDDDDFDDANRERDAEDENRKSEDEEEDEEDEEEGREEGE
jgi:hypothetical protein